MRTSDYNLNGSTVSEVYDLLQLSSDTSLTKHANGSFMLSKPSQNSELREIKFRRFTPIMKKNLSTLSQRTADITITPRFLRSNKLVKGREVQTHFRHDKHDLSPHFEITKNPQQPMLYYTLVHYSSEFPNNRGGIEDQAIELHFSLRLGPDRLQNVHIILTFDDIQRTCIISQLGSLSENQVLYLEPWASSRHAEYSESYGTLHFDFYIKGGYTEGSLINQNRAYLKIMFTPTGQTLNYNFNDSDADPDCSNHEQYIAPSEVNILTAPPGQTDVSLHSSFWYTSFETYGNNMLYIDESRTEAFTYANEVNLPIKPATVKTNLIGSVNEICANINEKLAGYFSNFKPSSTIHVVDADYNTYVLSMFEEDPLTQTQPHWTDTIEVPIGLSIEKYYQYYNGITDPVSTSANVTPKCYFTRVYNTNSAPSGSTYEQTLSSTVFGVHQVLFNFRKYSGSTSSTDCIWMYFDIDIHCDVDIFNISRDRMYHNTLEYIASSSWASSPTCWRSFNQCISTNNDTITNLIYANYLAHGLDIILKSPLMNNISNIIFVNETESQVIMKHTQQFSTANCINVYITDIEGQPIDITYLRHIYRAILLEIDYVFG